GDPLLAGEDLLAHLADKTGDLRVLRERVGLIEFLVNLAAEFIFLLDGEGRAGTGDEGGNGEQGGNQECGKGSASCFPGGCHHTARPRPAGAGSGPFSFGAFPATAGKVLL